MFTSRNLNWSVSITFPIVFAVAATGPAGVMAAFFKALLCTGIVAAVVSAYEDGFFSRSYWPSFRSYRRPFFPAPDPFYVAPSYMPVPMPVVTPIPVHIPPYIPAPAPTYFPSHGATVLPTAPHVDTFSRPSAAISRPASVPATASYTGSSFHSAGAVTRPAAVPPSAQFLGRTFVPKR